MDEQNENGQEQNNQKSVGSQMANKAVQKGKDAAKREMKKKAAAVMSKALSAALPFIIKAVLIIVIASIVMTLLVTAFDWFLYVFVSNKVDESTSDLIGQYCTIEKDGIKIDKDLAIKSMLKMLKEEIDLDLDELGLAVGKRGEFSGEWSDEYYEKVKNSTAAEYLYNYLKASLATELPYIPGSDPEVQGNIKIKRKKANVNKTVLEDTTDENTNVVQHKTIDTSSYGLSAEEVNITMDDIKNEYKIAWISDLHMMLPDQPTINTKWYSDHGTTFEQRNSIFNNSYLVLDKLVNCINGNDFDAVVFGGDIMDNYSDKNFEYLKRKIDSISGKKVMFLVADHDYLTEMTTNSGETSAESLGISEVIKRITIGKNGDSINLVGQNYSNKQISDDNASKIWNYLNETDNSLFFTHVPIESKTQASAMQEWSRNAHNGQVYYWSKEASSSEYNNPSEKYLNTLYNSTTLRGVFAGHVHSSGDFELNTGIKEHIFRASFSNSIGVITLTPSGNNQTSTIIEDNEEAEDLTYMWYEDFKKLLESDDNQVKESALKYFSLDEAWNLCIAKYYKEVENEEIKAYDVIEVKIPYRTMVSQYSVPFVFLMNLLLGTNNANYVDKVADLIAEESEIEFTIFDTIATDETTYTYTATQHNKSYDEETDTSETTSYSIKQVTVTTIEVDTIKANVTKAKTWILDQETKYALQATKEKPLGENGINKPSPNESEPEKQGSWRTGINEHWYEEIITGEWIKEGDTKTTFTPSRFLGLWKNDTGVYTKGASYNPEGIVVEYFLAGDNLLDKPVMNVLTNEEGFYSYFEENVSTQIHAELMRYLIHYYKTGEELDLSDLESIFEPDEFVESSYAGDFDVHDESLFIKDLETLKKALQGGYSQSGKLVENAEAFLDMQNTYKVNALFAASVSITETGGGRTGHAVDGLNNWFNVRSGNGWRPYGSAEESIMGFGWQIAQGSYYYAQGNYTVATIGVIYCPNTIDHPNQADKWIENTKAQIVRFYNAAGLDGDSYIKGKGPGAGGISGAGGEGYRGKYKVGDKEYIEYLQYAGPWKYNSYMGGNMKNSGCSVTSVAVILSGFGVDKNPEDVRRINPSGISITGVLNSFGLKTNVIRKPTQSQLLDHLKTGNPVIINAGTGYWSKGSGHYFPVLAADGNKVYVSNVGSSSKTGWMDVSKVLEDNKKVIFIKK